MHYRKKKLEPFEGTPNESPFVSSSSLWKGEWCSELIRVGDLLTVNPW